jgi:glycosyltransferase involved in cell wall biosynthesis
MFRYVTDDAASSYPLVVHSHLHWDWVWQRPQQFLSRLAARHPVLFVEPTHFGEEITAPRVVTRAVPQECDVTLLQMQFPLAWRGREAAVESRQAQLFCDAWLELGKRFSRPVQWFYDPMAVHPFAGLLNERAIVYDCMDELSQFRYADSQIVRREKFLLQIADVVFTGGRQMWEKRRCLNPNCHFYGCGVDVEHFGQARRAETIVPADLDTSRDATLGYFGVVDERMDYDLVAALADAQPNWTIAIVGPTAKVEEADLPRRDNIQWLGGRPYSDLPAYVKGFDVCLMPFALNEATQYINPTKALEYMATATPIVSTTVPDVVTNFGSVVQLAATHEQFIQCCREQVAQPDGDAIERGLRLARANTWEAIVARLEGHIADFLVDRATEEKSEREDGARRAASEYSAPEYAATARVAA